MRVSAYIYLVWIFPHIVSSSARSFIYKVHYPSSRAHMHLGSVMWGVTCGPIQVTMGVSWGVMPTFLSCAYESNVLWLVSPARSPIEITSEVTNISLVCILRHGQQGSLGFLILHKLFFQLSGDNRNEGSVDRDPRYCIRWATWTRKNNIRLIR